MTLPLYVHVGLPKTGTTAIQVNIFQKHSQIEYIGKYIKQSPRYSSLADIVNSVSRADYNAETAQAWQDVIFDARDTAVLNGKRSILFSEELLYPLGNANCSEIADHVKNVFLPDKVLITLRNQLDIIRSYYIHRLSHGRESVDFEKYLEANFDSVFKNSLNYLNSIQKYEELFGAENLLVLFYEDLVSSPEKYTLEITNFLNVDGLNLEKISRENTATSNRAIKSREYIKIFQKYKNLILPNTHFGRFIPGFIKNFSKSYVESGAPPEIQYSDHWRVRIEQQFAESNRNLAQKLGRDLGTLGYSV